MPTITVQIKNPSISGVNVVTQVTAAFAAASYPIKVRVSNLSDLKDAFPVVEGVAIPPHDSNTNDYVVSKKINLASAADVVNLATNIQRIAAKFIDSDVQFVIEEIAIGSAVDTWAASWKHGIEWYGAGLTLANRPSAAAFGIGPVQIDLATYVSDGNKWKADINNLNTDKAYICMGGDHPSPQYRSGFHRIPMDKGLPWYLAVNTHLGDVIPGYGNYLTWPEIKALQDQGVDVVSHGVGPHNNSWRRISTGGYIRYTGDSSTATLDISGTFPAITMTAALAGDQTDGSLGFAIDLTTAPYDTIAEVAAYINALLKWEFVLDPSLKGTELATNFLTQTTTNLLPTTVSITYAAGYATYEIPNHGFKSGDLFTCIGATPSNYNVTNSKISQIISVDKFTVPISGTPVTATVQGKVSARKPVCAGAGIVLSYLGTEYNNVWIEQTGSQLRVYFDGVALIAYSLSLTNYNTLFKLSAAINAAGITGLTCELSDDRRTAPNAAASLTSTMAYMHGNEASSNLEVCTARNLSAGYVRINAGLPATYLNNRRVEASVIEAATHGVTFKHFASSGAQCSHGFAPTTNVIGEVRGNPETISMYPMAVPVSTLPTGFHHVVELNDTYGITTDAHMTCLVDALADSPGHFIDSLVHAVSVDGTSGYALAAPENTADLTESQFVALCTALATNTDKVAALTFSELVKMKTIAQKPKNYLFNPKFKNSGESLLGAVALTNMSKLPGIQLVTPAQVTEASVADGRFTVASNSASAFTLLQWQAVIEPNVPYKLTAMLEYLSLASGNVYWEIGTATNNFDSVYGGALSAITSDKQSRNGLVSMDVELNPPTTHKAVARSKTGTYNVPVGTVKVKYAALPYITGISLAGAAPTTTTAQEVVNAFNTAMDGAITAGTYTEEWRRFASVENGKVVVKAPYNERNRQTEVLTIAADTGADQLTPVFGATLINASGAYDSSASAERFAVNIKLKVACSGKFVISNPVLREIRRF